MISKLGLVDLDTRDNSFYVLYNWCIKGAFSDTELIKLGNKMISNLSIDIEKLNTDSVFTRSFSVLVLCGVLKADGLFYSGEIKNRKSFLSGEMFNNWLDQATESFIKEKDLRGYLEDKSWAHSIAHFADLLIRFSLSPHCSRDNHLKILDTLAKKLVQPANSVFNTYEDGRLGRVVTTILMRNLISENDFKSWLLEFEPIFEKSMWSTMKENPKNLNVQFNAKTNTRMFLSKIYFMILFGDKEFVEMKEYTTSDLIRNKKSILDMLSLTLKRIDIEGLFKKD